MRFYFFLFLSFQFFSFHLFSQNNDLNPVCETSQSEFFIKDFYIKDFSRNLFYIEVKSTNRDLLNQKLEINPEKTKDSESPIIKNSKLIVKINNSEGDKIKGSYSYYKNSNSFSYELSFSENTKPGPVCVKLFDENYKLLSSFNYNLPNRMQEAGKLPLILKISPNGGVPGDTITLVGKNFQNDMDHLFIQVIDEEQEDYEYGDRASIIIQPFYLSVNDEKGFQEIKFTIPSEATSNYTFLEKIIGKKVKIKLLSNYRPSTIERIVILKKYWKWIAGCFTAFVTFLFIISIAFILKKINFIHEILLDPKSNSYSLSYFQSFSWTLVFLGSYFYVAICSGIILNTPDLPDFNFSLIGLMGISYGGLLTAHFLDNRKQIVVKRKDKPELKDLITDDFGIIDISKLQLLGFTLISIIVYLFYLLKSNVLQGLPGIPETLHTLLVTSQGGYLGSKAIEQKKSPEEKPISEDNKSVEEIKTI